VLRQAAEAKNQKSAPPLHKIVTGEYPRCVKSPKVPNSVVFCFRLVIPDAARRLIALQRPKEKPVRRGGLARRQSVERYLQDRVSALSALLPDWEEAPMTAAQLNESTDAAEYLKKAGWSESRVRAWLLMQYARNAVINTDKPKPTPKVPK
jgi:hypothetical protein